MAVTIFCNLWFCDFSLRRQHSGSHSMPHWLGARGEEREREIFPGALTTPEKEGNVNEISQKECLRLVEAGWLRGKKQLLINCQMLLGFYQGLSSATQRSLPHNSSCLSTGLHLDCNLSFVSSPICDKPRTVSSSRSHQSLPASMGFSLSTPSLSVYLPITLTWLL